MPAPARHSVSRRSIHLAGLIVAALGWAASPAALSPTGLQLAEYRDPTGRFLFAYPQAFGTPSAGTNDEFGNREAATRFSVFSTQGIGGEAVLSRGRVSLDVQAAGGLYDDIASEALPAALKASVETALPPLTVSNLCERLGRERHLELGAPTFATLTAPQREALAKLDTLGNVAPKVLHCRAITDTVTFDKEAAVVAGGPRRRVYGAVRFLSGRYSAFQIIRAGQSLDTTAISDMQKVVASWRGLK